MWLIADLGLILLIAVFGRLSMKKGFLKSSYSGVSGFVALVLVFNLHAPFQVYLEHSYVGDTVREKIRMNVAKSISESEEKDSADSDDETQEIIEGLMLPKFMTSWISDTIQTQKESYSSLKADLTDGITDMVFPMVMQILSALFLYLIIRIGLWIFFCILKLFAELPLLGALDRALGAAIGGINAVLIIYIAAALLMLLTPAEQAPSLEAGINSTFIFKYFYYNNLLTNIFF